MTPETLLYTKSHEWVSIATNDAGEKIATIGISQFAIDALTDLIFIDLPELGKAVEAGEQFGEVESVKAVSEMYSPVSGVIVAVNEVIGDSLETLVQDPYENGWLIKIKLSDGADDEQLLDFAAYQTFCKEESH